MKTQQQFSGNISISNSQTDVLNFLRAKNVKVSLEKDSVKSFYDGNDYILAVYDVQNQKNNLLITIKDFTQNEDTLIELNNIFRMATQDTSTYHILKFARQATDEVLGMLPTFQAMFGKRTVETQSVKVNMNNVFIPRSANIAA